MRKRTLNYLSPKQLCLNSTCIVITESKVPSACTNLLYHHISQNDCTKVRGENENIVRLYSMIYIPCSSLSTDVL